MPRATSTRTTRARRRSADRNTRPSPDADRRRVQAEILPWLRGQLSVRRVVGTVQDDDQMLRFVNSHDGPRLAELGTSCPDHFLRTKIKTSVRRLGPGEWRRRGAEEGAGRRRSISTGRITQAYYERCQRPDSPAMRDPNPTVVLIPGLGMIAWGKNKSESRVTAEFYNCAIEVMRGAEAIDQYEAMDEQEAFDIEYWLLEEAKLQRMPPGEGARPAGHRRRRRRRGDRQGHRAPAGQRRRAHRLRRSSTKRRRRRRRRRSSTDIRRGHRRGRHRGSATAVPPSASPAT